MRPNIVSSLALLDKHSAIRAVDFGLVHDFVYAHHTTYIVKPLTHLETAPKHDGPAYITTTLYDLFATLQTLAAPDNDAYIVSVVRLCTGRLFRGGGMMKARTERLMVNRTQLQGEK